MIIGFFRTFYETIKINMVHFEMKKGIIFYILLLFGMSFIAPVAFSAEYFVASSGGNDTYSKMQNNITHPWATIQHSMSQLSAGDTLYFALGHILLS